MRPSLDKLVTLLPTPLSREGRPDGGGNARGQGSLERGGGIMLSQAVKLLPTPTRSDFDQDRMSDTTRRASITAAMNRLAESESNGATMSPPSDAGKPSTGLRLSPWFVEWMIGAPQGWSDPDCLLSATEFKSSAESSLASTSLSERPSA